MKLILAITFLCFAPLSLAQLPDSSWRHRLAPLACLISSSSGVNRSNELKDRHGYDVNAEIYIAVPHPGADYPEAQIVQVEPSPYLLTMQIWTNRWMRQEGMVISGIRVVVEDAAVTPVFGPDWKSEDFPHAYLGGGEAQRFLDFLESGGVPLVEISFENDVLLKIPVGTEG